MSSISIKTCQHVEHVQHHSVQQYSIQQDFEVCGDDINVQLVSYSHPTNGEIKQVLCKQHLRLLQRRLRKFERNLPGYASNVQVISTF
jgi:hypothetical protein